MSHSKDCELCTMLFRKRPACREWLVGWAGNYLFPQLLGAVIISWVLWGLLHGG